MTDKPITVSESPVTAQLWSAMRDCLKVGGAVLAAKGVFDASWIEPALGLFMVLGPIVWSQVSARMKHRKLKTLAHHCSDDVAVIK